MYNVLNKLSGYRYFCIRKNFTLYTFLIVSKIVESLQCILKENKLGTLHGFVIFIHDMQFPTWTSALSHKIIEKECATNFIKQI